MVDNMNGARYIDIRYCPFCGRKLYKNAVKRGSGINGICKKNSRIT